MPMDLFLTTHSQSVRLPFSALVVPLSQPTSFDAFPAIVTYNNVSEGDVREEDENRLIRESIIENLRSRE